MSLESQKDAEPLLTGVAAIHTYFLEKEYAVKNGRTYTKRLVIIEGENKTKTVVLREIEKISWQKKFAAWLGIKGATVSLKEVAKVSKELLFNAGRSDLIKKMNSLILRYNAGHSPLFKAVDNETIENITKSVHFDDICSPGLDAVVKSKKLTWDQDKHYHAQLYKLIGKQDVDEMVRIFFEGTKENQPIFEAILDKDFHEKFPMLLRELFSPNQKELCKDFLCKAFKKSLTEAKYGIAAYLVLAAKEMVKGRFFIDENVVHDMAKICLQSDLGKLESGFSKVGCDLGNEKYLELMGNIKAFNKIV